MSRAIFYLLASFMIFAIVNCRKLPTSTLPARIDGLENQCRNRGFPGGACLNYAYFQGQMECDSVPCAESNGHGRYKVKFTGRVDDGTPCSIFEPKACIAGVCTRVDYNRLPILVGEGAKIFCYPR